MTLSRIEIERGLALLGARALADGLVLEIAVYGGAAMMLALDARKATRDVDAIARGDVSAVRRYAAEIAETEGWPPDWLNDAVKGFISPKDAEQTSFARSYPSEERPGLRVFFPTPDYLLAMKCLAMRIGAGDDTQDLSDIMLLMEVTGIETVDALLDLVSSYYPGRSIPPRTAFGIEQIVEHYQVIGQCAER